MMNKYLVCFGLFVVGLISWRFWTTYRPENSMSVPVTQSLIASVNVTQLSEPQFDQPQINKWQSKLETLLVDLHSSVQPEKLVLEWLPSLSTQEMKELFAAWANGSIEIPSGAAGGMIFEHLGRSLGLSALLSIDDSLINISQRTALTAFAVGAAEQNPWDFAQQVSGIANKIKQSSCADGLVQVANTRELPEAVQLIELVASDVSYFGIASSKISNRWFAGKDAKQTIDALQQFLNSALPTDLRNDLASQCIALQMRNSPAATIASIAQLIPTSLDSRVRGNMWVSAVNVVPPEQLDVLRGSLTDAYSNGDLSVARSFQMIGHKLAKASDVNAANVIAHTLVPELADNLKFGFVLAIRSRDPEAASVWAMTVRDDELRNVLLEDIRK